MGIIEISILVLIVLAAVILTFFVMIQDETGEGMGGIFGGASTTPFGSRAGNVLTRITTVLAVVFFACALGYAYLTRTPTDTADLLGKAKEKQLERAAEKPWFIRSSESGSGDTASSAGTSLLESASKNTLSAGESTTINVPINVTTTSDTADTNSGTNK